MRLTHVRLLVDDFASAFRFYRDALGLRPTFGDETGGYADFDAGDATLALFDAAEQMEAAGSPDTRADGDAAALIFRVEDVDEAVAQLRGRGVEIVAEPASRPDWGIRVAYLRDPAGNLIELNHPIPMSP